MRLKAAFTVCCAAVVCVTAANMYAGRANSAPTSFIDILRNELNREFPILKTKGDPAPYYVAYEATEETTDNTTASDGAIMASVHNHARGVDTTVRVGTPQFDNYHVYKGSRGQFTNFAPLSLDNNTNQIGRTLWAQTDRVYTAGVRRFLQVKTDEQLLAEDQQKDSDFSIENAASHYSETTPVYPYDRDAWASKLRNWSAEFRKHPKILGSEVSFRSQREIRTFVDSEGSAIEQGSNLFRLQINAQALAPDGMAVTVFDSVEVSDPAHLPPDSALASRVHEAAAKLDRLIAAPPAEPIVCPAILSGRAAAVFFHEIFGHRVEGHRQKDVQDGQTFSNMIGQRVLPDFISVTFDPTRREYDGHDLIGSYAYDDEGVKARPVHVVENGVLKTFLLARSPVGKFDHSNGHGRRQPGHEIVSRQSNLIVESSKKIPDIDLRSELIAEIKRQNKPYGLYFDEVASGYTTTGRRGLQAFTVVPLVVYRVFPDGRPDELIRGVNIVGTPLASFQKIIATSDDVAVFNGYCGAESGSIPVSAVSPAILVSEIEVQKKENVQQALPILSRPEAK